MLLAAQAAGKGGGTRRSAVVADEGIAQELVVEASLTGSAVHASACCDGGRG